MIFRTYDLPRFPVLIIRTFKSSSELPPTVLYDNHTLSNDTTIYVCLPRMYLECRVAM